MNSDWKSFKLMEIASKKRWAMNGGPFGSKLSRKHYSNTGIPVIRGCNLPASAKFSFDDFVYVSEEKADELIANNAHPGDLVFTQRGTLGQVGLIPLDSPFRRFVISQSQMKLTVDSNLADPSYLYHLFSSPAVVQAIHNLAFSAGVPHINLDILRNFQVDLPPLPIQLRIAGILSAYDDLIENSQRRIKILEEMARRLYREWFVHFRFPGHEDCRFVESPLGEIPEGWEGLFSDLATIERNGVNPSQFPAEEFDHFSIPAYDNGMQPAIEAGQSILSNKYLLADPVVLLSKLNPRIPRVWMPVLSGHRRAVTSTEFLCLKPSSGLTQEFIYAKCCSKDFALQFGSLAIGTSTSHQRVKPENLIALPSSVPDAITIQRFTELVSPMLLKTQVIRLEIQNLRRTRDLLLPRLLSGQIDVEALPEPESIETELLE
jgi:type I restriction enzyme S subunit